MPQGQRVRRLAPKPAPPAGWQGTLVEGFVKADYQPDFSGSDWATGGPVPDYARRGTGIREVYGAPGLQYLPTEEQMLTQQLVTLAVVRFIWASGSRRWARAILS